LQTYLLYNKSFELAENIFMIYYKNNSE